MFLYLKSVLSPLYGQRKNILRQMKHFLYKWWIDCFEAQFINYCGGLTSDESIFPFLQTSGEKYVLSSFLFFTERFSLDTFSETTSELLSHHQLQDALKMAFPPHYWEWIHLVQAFQHIKSSSAAFSTY